MPDNETITPVDPAAQGVEAADQETTANKLERKKVDKAKQSAATSPKIPNPFRPRHLTAMIKKHAAATEKKPDEIDPFQFIREHGTPNPVRLYRVTGTHGQDAGKAMEFNAVDPTDATNQYIVAGGVREVHTWHFDHAVMDE